MSSKSLAIVATAIAFYKTIKPAFAAAQGCTNDTQCQTLGSDWICSSVDHFCVRGCANHGCASGGTCSSNGLCYWGNAPNDIGSEIKSHLGIVIGVIVAVLVVIASIIIWRRSANKKRKGMGMGTGAAFAMPFANRMPFNRGAQQQEGEWHPLVDAAGPAGGQGQPGRWLSASPTQQEYAIPPLQSPGMAGDLSEHHLNTRTSIDDHVHANDNYGHGGI